MSEQKTKIIVYLALAFLLVFVGVELGIRWRIVRFDKAQKAQIAERWNRRHPANQKRPYETRDISDPAAYDFYSSVLKTEGPYIPGEAIAIFLAQEPFVPSFHCDQLLPKEEQDMVERAKAQDNIARLWKRQFQLVQPYFLVPPMDIIYARDCVVSLRHHHSLLGCEPYLHVRGLLYLSIPVFNSDHSRALITVERLWFGDSRTDGLLTIFRKTIHGWVPDPQGLSSCKWSFLTDQ